MNLNNRRDLLKTLGATVTGGFVASSLGYAANETIQDWAFIGTGGRAQALMKALAQNIQGVRMAAVCDVWGVSIWPTEGQIAGSGAFPHEKLSGDPLDRKDIDAVVIGTPNHQHVAMLSSSPAHRGKRCLRREAANAPAGKKRPKPHSKRKTATNALCRWGSSSGACRNFRKANEHG